MDNIVDEFIMLPDGGESFRITRECIDASNEYHANSIISPEELFNVRHLRRAWAHLGLAYGLGEIRNNPLEYVLSKLESKMNSRLRERGYTPNVDEYAELLVRLEKKEEFEEADVIEHIDFACFEVLGSILNIRTLIEEEEPAHRIAEETMILMTGLLQINMGKDFMDGLTAILSRKIYGKRGGGVDKKPKGIRAAIRYALEDLQRRHPAIFEGVKTKSGRALGVWTLLTRETCAENNYARFDDCVLFYDPDRMVRGKRTPSLYQIENPDEPLARGKAITYGKRFIDHVDAVYKEMRAPK